MEGVPTRALFARYPQSLPPRFVAPLLNWFRRQSALLGDHLHYLGLLGAIFTAIGFLYVVLFAGVIFQLLGRVAVDLFWLFVVLVIAEMLAHRAPTRPETIEQFCDESNELLRRATLAENARETGWRNAAPRSYPEFPWGASRVLTEQLTHVALRSSRGQWVPLRDLYRIADDLRREMGPFLA